jgi:uncharacterized protein with ATP-grasp and redox domains
MGAHGSLDDERRPRSTMHTTLDCVPCFARQALEAARFAADDEPTRRRIVRAALAMLAAETDLDQSPPQIGQHIHRLVRELAGNDDPYGALKGRSNAAARAALPGLRALVQAATDPLEAAVRLAIAANVLDAGMNAAAMEGGLHDGAAGDEPGDEVVRALEPGLREPLHGSLSAFREAVAGAARILFLTDNCGEIVVDRLLVEQLPMDRLTIAVRGAPVLNDATLGDARFAGLDRLAPVIDNGSDAPGTLLGDCSPRFRQVFAEADLVIAKGQGNYETLSGADADVFFLFKVKCPLIADHAGFPAGANALVQRRAPRTGPDATGRG